MSEYSIAVVIGSLRRDSLNRRMATALAGLAPPEWSFNQIRIDDLPPYNQDDDERPAPAVQRLRAEIVSADGVLFVTPEYNRSVPGILKNAIDHGSRPYGKSAWAEKPAGIIGVSVGAIGTAVAQQHLRTILAYLDMPTLGQPEAFLQAKDTLFDPGVDGPLRRVGHPAFDPGIGAWIGRAGGCDSVAIASGAPKPLLRW
jgi:chromate reductase